MLQYFFNTYSITRIEEITTFSEEKKHEKYQDTVLMLPGVHSLDLEAWAGPGWENF